MKLVIWIRFSDFGLPWGMFPWVAIPLGRK